MADMEKDSGGNMASVHVYIELPSVWAGLELGLLIITNKNKIIVWLCEWIVGYLPDRVPLAYFSFRCLCFGIIFEKPFQDQCQESFPLCFLPGILHFQVLLLRFNSLWVGFSVWCKIKLQFHYFACEHLILSAPVVEETILSPLCMLDTLVKISWLYMYDFILGFYMLYYWYICLYPSTLLLSHCNFVIYFEILEVWCLCFVHFQDYSGYFLVLCASFFS